MPFDSGYDDNPVRGVKGLTTEYAAGIVVIGSLVALILIRRGFRGVSAGGASIKIG
jgi:hypothetical protein